MQHKSNRTFQKWKESIKNVITLCKGGAWPNCSHGLDSSKNIGHACPQNRLLLSAIIALCSILLNSTLGTVVNGVALKDIRMNLIIHHKFLMDKFNNHILFTYFGTISNLDRERNMRGLTLFRKLFCNCILSPLTSLQMRTPGHIFQFTLLCRQSMKISMTMSIRFFKWKIVPQCSGTLSHITLWRKLLPYQHKIPGFLQVSGSIII